VLLEVEQVKQIIRQVLMLLEQEMIQLQLQLKEQMVDPLRFQQEAQVIQVAEEAVELLFQGEQRHQEQLLVV
jgi:hypothetical protein